MKKYLILLSLLFAVFVCSAVKPYNYFVWVGESMPVFIGLIILSATFYRFRLTYITYLFILLGMVMILIGAHYTFSRVPLFDLIRDFYGLERNNYDKLGHFVQGIIPVLVTREILIRLKVVRGRYYISILSYCVSMAITAGFEIIEYVVSCFYQTPPELYMGSQGYIWDTQTDMFFAFLGALSVIFFFERIHDRIIAKEFPESAAS